MEHIGAHIAMDPYLDITNQRIIFLGTKHRETVREVGRR